MANDVRFADLSNIEKTNKEIEKVVADITRYDDAIAEMTKRLNEHAKYDYEKPEGALPHMCAECWDWKKARRAYRTNRNALADQKRHSEEYLTKLQQRSGNDDDSDVEEGE